MNRRKLLAGVGSTAVAATAGCTGILGGGGGGGGCSVPSDKSLKKMLPGGGNGFTRAQAMEMSGSQQGMESAAFGVYSKGGTRYSLTIAKYKKKKDAKKSTNNVGQNTQSGGKVVYVRSGKYIFAAGAKSGKTSDMKTLIKMSALSDGCVSSNAKTYKG